MSVQNDIHQYLTKLSDGAGGGQVMVTAPQVAIQLGIAGDSVAKTFFNLNKTGKIEVVRGANGRSILGFRVLVPAGEARRVTRIPRVLDRERQPEPVRVDAVEPQRTRRRGLLTPNLDAYAEQRAKFDRMQREMGDYIEAVFKTNPLAEEGMAVLGRLHSIEEQYIEVRRSLDEAQRELRGSRERRMNSLARTVAESGALVTHGD